MKTTNIPAHLQEVFDEYTGATVEILTTTRETKYGLESDVLFRVPEYGYDLCFV